MILISIKTRYSTFLVSCLLVYGRVRCTNVRAYDHSFRVCVDFNSVSLNSFHVNFHTNLAMLCWVLR